MGGVHLHQCVGAWTWDTIEKAVTNSCLRLLTESMKKVYLPLCFAYLFFDRFKYGMTGVIDDVEFAFTTTTPEWRGRLLVNITDIR